MNNFVEYYRANLERISFEENTVNHCLQIEIGEIIKSIRICKNISQFELSKLSNISQSNISKIEQGKYNISIKNLERLLKALGAHLKMEVEDL